MFMRMHGSIFPELILPVICCGLWATLMCVLVAITVLIFAMLKARC